MERLYIKRLTFALKIDSEMGAFIISLLIKALMYASDLRITLDQMPGAWHELEYTEDISNTRGALNTNFVFVLFSVLIFIA